MRILNFISSVSGVMSIFFGLIVFVSFPYILMAETDINPKLIDSCMDKMFLGFLTIGLAIFSVSVGFILFSKGNKEEINTKNLWNITFLGAFLFLIGIVYHPIAGSPW